MLFLGSILSATWRWSYASSRVLGHPGPRSGRSQHLAGSDHEALCKVSSDKGNGRSGPAEGPGRRHRSAQREGEHARRCVEPGVRSPPGKQR